jgi:hypothetical protein
MVHPETLSGRGKYSLRPVLSYLGLVLLTLWRGERFRCKVYAPSFRESVDQRQSKLDEVLVKCKDATCS